MGIVTIPPKYQVVIPKEIREWLGSCRVRRSRRIDSSCALAAGDGRNGRKMMTVEVGNSMTSPGNPKKPPVAPVVAAARCEDVPRVGPSRPAFMARPMAQ